MIKACLLILISLIATIISFFVILYPVQGIFNYMGWPVFNGAGLHVGTWMLPLPLVFGLTYYVLFKVDQQRGKSRHQERKT
jgi:hypothetical protein